MNHPVWTEHDERALREILPTAFPAREPSPALEARIAHLMQRPPQPRRAAAFRWPLAFTACAALAGLAVFIARLPSAGAAALARMQGAMKDARSMHSILKSREPNGTWVVTQETWYQDG